jgi:hypothetical protein
MCVSLKISLKGKEKSGMVAHTCNLSYSGGGERLEVQGKIQILDSPI